MIKLLQILRNNRFSIGIAIGAVILLFLFFAKKEEPSISPISETSMITSSNEEEQVEVGQIFVDIKGEIQNPGVYEMPPDTRVKDVINMAGGFTTNADQNMINLAQKVFDEMIIIVPKLGEKGGGENGSTTGTSKIRINYATLEEIESLPGIGPSKAEAIIQYRDEHGYFKKIEDLLEVSGIGEKTLEGFQEEIQVP